MAACRPYPVTWYSPTGIVGCETYGVGIASHWPGPGVARNDCEYPWTDCIPIRITALDTGRSIVVQPSMYCDCYTGTADERLVDLDPATLRALGLGEMLDRGLFRVTVQPATGSPTEVGQPLVLPDTAMR